MLARWRERSEWSAWLLTQPASPFGTRATVCLSMLWTEKRDYYERATLANATGLGGGAFQKLDHQYTRSARISPDVHGIGLTGH